MDHTGYMRRVIELSAKGMRDGHGGPFGSVIVRDGEIVGEAHNEVLSSRDPTAHAETLAIRRASARLKTFDLSDCDIYTNGAPCCMCASAMLWARLRSSYYVLPMEDSAAIGLGDDHLYAELARPLDSRQILPMIQLPELADEARSVLREWHEMPGKVSF
jgi:guanine deaminase